MIEILFCEERNIMLKKILSPLLFLLLVSAQGKLEAVDADNTIIAGSLLQPSESIDRTLPEQLALHHKNSKKNKLLFFLLGSAAGLALVAVPACAVYAYAYQQDNNGRQIKLDAQRLKKQQKKVKDEQQKKAKEKRKQEKEDLKRERDNKIKSETEDMIAQYKDSQKAYNEFARTERKQLKDKKIELQENLHIKSLTASDLFFKKKTSSKEKELLQQLEKDMTGLEQQIREIEDKQSVFNRVDCAMTQYNSNIGPYHPSNKKA